MTISKNHILNSGGGRPTRVVTTNTTLFTLDAILLVYASAPVTITLPEVPSPGRVYTIKDAGRNATQHNITVIPYGTTETIDGQGSYILGYGDDDGESVDFVHDGTNWNLI